MVEVAIEYEYETDKKTIYMQSHRLQNGFGHAKTISIDAGNE